MTQIKRLHDPQKNSAPPVTKEVNLTLLPPDNLQILRRVGSDGLLISWMLPDDDEVTGYLVIIFTSLIVSCADLQLTILSPIHVRVSPESHSPKVKILNGQQDQGDGAVPYMIKENVISLSDYVQSRYLLTTSNDRKFAVRAALRRFCTTSGWTQLWR